MKVEFWLFAAFKIFQKYFSFSECLGKTNKTPKTSKFGSKYCNWENSANENFEKINDQKPKVPAYHFNYLWISLFNVKGFK